MKPLLRKVLASFSVTLGLLLVMLEVRRGDGGGVQWFWVLVGVLMLVLGTIELLAPKPPPLDPP